MTCSEGIRVNRIKGMKKLFLLLIFVLLCCSLFAHPASEMSVNEKSEVRVVALKGPTAMGLVKLMDDSKNNPDTLQNSYTFSLEASPDAVVPAIAKGEVDVAAIPANLAATLFNNTGKVKILAVNTLGVLYVVGSSDAVINSVDDIKGKTIYASGKGSTPQYALETVLNGFNLVDGKDVFVEWKSEHAECVASLLSSPSSLALLPQPFVTSALMQNSNLSVLLDLNDAWLSLTGSPLVTGCVVVTKDAAENKREAIDNFLLEYKSSVDWVNENIEEASLLIESEGIIKAQIAKKALPSCNIVLVEGEEMKKMLSVYYDALYKQNPKSIGGVIPNDEFYY